MTTPIKQYQNISYKELIALSENNPNRNRTLDSIGIQTNKLYQETSLDKLNLKGYNVINLNPSGIMSIFACITDPINYSLSTKGARTQQIIEITTKLQEQTEELKNTAFSRKRKKIHDLIGAAYNCTHFEDKDYIELFSGLSFIRNIHFVLMKSDICEDNEKHDSSLKGEIVFSSDPANWKRDNPIWIADYRARWVAIPSEHYAVELHKLLFSWLDTIEQTGWIIQWPEADGTKKEIIEQLSLVSTWQPTDTKLTKEILALRLGRAKCNKVFTQWITND